MATHSSVLAWRIPGRGEPGGCRLWGRTGSDRTEATQQPQVSCNQRNRPYRSGRLRSYGHLGPSSGGESVNQLLWFPESPAEAGP